MTAPVPATAGAPVNVGGVTIAAPPLASSKKNIATYGLVSPGNNIVIGALAPLLGLVTDANGMVKELDVLQAFANAAPDVKAHIQNLLAFGHFYTSSAAKDGTVTASGPQPGVTSEADLRALAGALNEADTAQSGARTVAAQNSTDPQNPLTPDITDFTTALTNFAAAGQKDGLLAALQARQDAVTKAQVASAEQAPIEVTKYNRAQWDFQADNMGQALIGRFLTQGEKDQLYAQFGTKNSPGAARAEAKAAQLDKLAKQTATANEQVYASAENPSGTTERTGIQDAGLQAGQQRGLQAEGESALTPVGVDAFLSAFRQGQDSQNPYGFTPTTWALYARQAGLGADASPLVPANQELVARWLASSLLAKYGSWATVTAGLLGGPTAAAAYAANPDSARWSVPDSTGSSVITKINGIMSALTQGSPAQLAQEGVNTGIDPGLGGIQPGTNISSLSSAENSSLSAQPQIVQSEAPVLSPQDIIAQGIKQDHPTEYGAHNLAKTFGDFLGLLGGVQTGALSGSAQGVG